MSTLRLMLGVLLALAPVACDDGGSKDAKPATADKGKDKGKAGGATKTGADADKGRDADKGGDGAGGGEPAGDDGGGEDVVASFDERVQRAAKLAKQIEDKPEDAVKILEAADLDRDAFEELITAIGKDPELSEQYRVAMAGD